MRTKFFIYLAVATVFLSNCGNQSHMQDVKTSDKSASQQDDGTLVLKIERAGYYRDETNPSNNTAEWNVYISKPGSYKVWLSSATRDTTDLSYTNNVRVNLPDCQLVGIPASYKVIHNSEDVLYPYRADSYMGSVYISQPGEYNIQVVGERVISKASDNNRESFDKSRLLAVILTPIMR